MAKVQIENIQKRFAGGVVAVDDVSLDIPDGKFVILVGPSGCGKTTLLRLLAGLEEATGGRITIGDKDVTHEHPRERDIAMVFQNYALYPHMSVRRNMSFALELKKIAASDIDRRIANAASILSIETLLNRRPKQLSGGQRQRVALGRAIVREPAVFLFDEPLSNLDAKLRAAMRSELIKLHKRLGTTIVYVTHDQVEAMTMGQIVVVMNEGVIQQAGEPLEVYRNPKNRFVAEFIGSPSMNFLSADVRGSGANAFADVGGICIPLPRAIAEEVKRAEITNVVLGIRPEHFILLTDGSHSNDALQLEGLVEVVEPLGAETILEVKSVGHTLLARLMSDQVPAMGQHIRLSVDQSRIFFFDNITGKRLGIHERETDTVD